jgi:hypothetical protein
MIGFLKGAIQHCGQRHAPVMSTPAGSILSAKVSDAQPIWRQCCRWEIAIGRRPAVAVVSGEIRRRPLSPIGNH